MLLHLTGRLDPGESYAVVSVPEKVLPPKMFQLELVAVGFCNEADHADTHFAATEEAPFPTQAVYAERIDVNVPRPRQVTHRRRTMYFVPYADEDDDDADDDRRLRRSVFEEEETSQLAKRFKRADEVRVYDLQFQAAFQKNSVEAAFADFANSSPQSWADKMNDTLATRVDNFFLNLMDNQHPEVVVTPNEGSRSLGQLKLTLKPMTRVGTDDAHLWTILGFDAAEITSVGDKYYLTNPTRHAKVLMSKPDVKVTAKFLALYAADGISASCPDTLRMLFIDGHIPVKSILTVDPGSLPDSKSFLTPSFFFFFLLEQLTVLFNLRQRFTAISYDDASNSIELSRSAFLPQLTATPSPSAESFFSLMLKFGKQLQKKLNLANGTLNLKLGHTKPVLIPLAAPPTTDEALDSEAQENATRLQDDFYNQTTTHPLLKELVASHWPSIAKKRKEEEVEAARVFEAEFQAEHDRKKKMREEAEAAAQKKQEEDEKAAAAAAEQQQQEAKAAAEKAAAEQQQQEAEGEGEEEEEEEEEEDPVTQIRVDGGGRRRR